MTFAHDRLCPAHLRTRGHGTCHACVLITAVRADEGASWQAVVESLLAEHDVARALVPRARMLDDFDC